MENNKTNKPKYEIVNHTWIKSNIDIDECYKITKEYQAYVYAIKIDAIVSIEVGISKGVLNTFSLILNTGNGQGLAIMYWDNKEEFDKDLEFFETLLINR